LARCDVRKINSCLNENFDCANILVTETTATI
jgi:hypothetical protein